MSEIVSLDEKGRLVLPKKIRTEAHISLQSKLVARAAGVGRVELFDPEVLASKAQKIGMKKLAGWKEESHEVSRYMSESMKER